MLKTISPLISPALLKILAEMGHGDEILFADAHFPAYSMGPQVLRADGISVSEMLNAVLPLIDLENRAPALIMMAPDMGDTLNAEVIARYRQAVLAHQPSADILHIARQAFYQRTSQAFAIVMTGECASYGNLLLRKGVTH